jgi:hypothetical protein
MLRLQAPPGTPLRASIGSGDDPVNPEVKLFTPLLEAIFGIIDIVGRIVRPNTSGRRWPPGESL